MVLVQFSGQSVCWFLLSTLPFNTFIMMLMFMPQKLSGLQEPKTLLWVGVLQLILTCAMTMFIFIPYHIASAINSDVDPTVDKVSYLIPFDLLALLMNIG